MNLGIDIDDTLTNLHRIKLKCLKNYLKENKLNYKIIDKNSNYFLEMVNWTEEEYRKFWSLNADKLLAVARPRPYVKEVLKKLRQEGHKIFIITARTTEWHKDPYQLSFDWLNKHKIEYDELLVGHTDKAKISLEKNIDLFIDDFPRNLDQVSASGIPTIAMSGRHNLNYENSNVLRLKNWKQIYRYIKKIEKTKNA